MRSAENLDGTEKNQTLHTTPSLSPSLPLLSLSASCSLPLRERRPWHTHTKLQVICSPPPSPLSSPKSPQQLFFPRLNRKKRHVGCRASARKRRARGRGPGRGDGVRPHAYREAPGTLFLAGGRVGDWERGEAENEVGAEVTAKSKRMIQLSSGTKALALASLGRRWAAPRPLPARGRGRHLPRGVVETYMLKEPEAETGESQEENSSCRRSKKASLARVVATCSACFFFRHFLLLSLSLSLSLSFPLASEADTERVLSLFLSLSSRLRGEGGGSARVEAFFGFPSPPTLLVRSTSTAAPSTTTNIGARHRRSRPQAPQGGRHQHHRVPRPRDQEGALPDQGHLRGEGGQDAAGR